jgi:hypothetical protein
MQLTADGVDLAISLAIGQESVLNAEPGKPTRADASRRLNWSAGGPRVAGLGPCRGSIHGANGQITLELARHNA